MKGAAARGLALAGLLSTPCAGARAEAGAALENRFGSDAANTGTFWSLLKNTTHLEASAGVFLANLSGGITSLTAMMDDTGSNQAIDSIGRGQGLVRELRFGLEVAGNEAFFSYLSDQLWAEAEQAARDRLGNRVAEEAILMLMGELRPDLTALLGPDAKTWLRAEYGDLRGKIDDAWRFAVRDGQPWFGGRDAGWETRYFQVEAGVFPDGRGKLDEFRRRNPFESTGDEGAGFYLRYSRFTRPVVLGFGEDLGQTGFILQDAEMTTWSAGIRYELLTCGNFCFRVSGTMAPFTGWSMLDLGPLGTTNGVSFGGGGELKVSYPIHLFAGFHVSPYASFRADFLLPLLGSYNDADIEKAQLWAPDYLMWGPTAGLTGKF